MEERPLANSTPPLSPAAQAVWDAYKSGGLETALIAAADQVVPEDLKEPRGTGFRWGGWAAKQGVRRRLLALAAALAQPEPEGVTDFEEELMAAWDKAILLPRTGRLAEYRAWLAHVLALVWAVGRRPTTKPVPVAERLPGPEDCDEYGFCWFWNLQWERWRAGWQDDECTHWLPYHALPVPGAEEAPSDRGSESSLAEFNDGGTPLG
jgi:hypothetical protein